MTTENVSRHCHGPLFFKMAPAWEPAKKIITHLWDHLQRNKENCKECPRAEGKYKKRNPFLFSQLGFRLCWRGGCSPLHVDHLWVAPASSRHSFPSWCRWTEASSWLLGACDSLEIHPGVLLKPDGDESHRLYRPAHCWQQLLVGTRSK